ENDRPALCFHSNLQNHLQNTLSEGIACRDGKQFSELGKPLDKQIQKSTIVLFTKPLAPAEVPFSGSTDSGYRGAIHAQKTIFPPSVLLQSSPSTIRVGFARCR